MTNAERIEMYNEAAKNAKQARNMNIHHKIIMLELNMFLSAMCIYLFQLGIFPSNVMEILSFVLITSCAAYLLVFISSVIITQKIYKCEIELINSHPIIAITDYKDIVRNSEHYRFMVEKNKKYYCVDDGSEIHFVIPIRPVS